MAAARRAVDYRAELAKDYARWWDVYENGSRDSFYADGVNLLLIKGHIEIDKQRIVENYAVDDYPADYYRDDPPDVSRDYMARPDGIRADARATLVILEADENFLYLRSVRPALDPKTAKRLCIDNVIRYVTGLRKYIADDLLLDMRRYRPEELYSLYGYASALRECAERTRAAITAKDTASDTVNRGRDVQPSACTPPKFREVFKMEALKTEYRFHLEKEARKPLVAAIGELLGVKPRYLAAPSYGYEIGDCRIDRCGTVTVADGFNAEQVCGLLKELTERGFEFEPFSNEEDVGDGETVGSEVIGGGVEDVVGSVGEVVDQETSNTVLPENGNGGGGGDDGEAVSGESGDEDGRNANDGANDSSDIQTDGAENSVAVTDGNGGEGGGITISVPVTGFTPAAYANLERLVTAKAWILKTMTGAEELPIERDKRHVSFPWFKSGSDYRAVDAYSRLIAALCETVKKKQRVTSVERQAGEEENPRYKARCFLLSIGFIGDEYAQARKILLAGFSGNGSHCSGDGKKSAVAVPEPSDDETREEA